MRVSQVNNQIFEGKFKNSGALREIVGYADKSSLLKFNEIVEKASSKNDNLLFSFNKTHKFLGSTGDLRIEYAYNLVKENIEDLKKENIFTVIFTENFYYTPESRKNVKAKILGSFFPTLENLYPTNKTDAISNETEEQITKELLNKLA